MRTISDLKTESISPISSSAGTNGSVVIAGANEFETSDGISMPLYSGGAAGGKN